MKDEVVVIILEAENFGNGWCILPVLVEKETKMKEAWQNGDADYPEMALYSGGRYRYSGTKVPGSGESTSSKRQAGIHV